MALILNIETTTSVCSVALASGCDLLAYRESRERNAHSSRLSVFVREIFEEAGIGASQLDAVAVSGGPGSYTGLRIGVSLAKGICYGVSKPLIAVDTLQALAANALRLYPEIKEFICPMIDARRMEVYAGIYDKNLNPVMPVGAHIIDQDSFADYRASAQVYFCGDGSVKCKEILTGNNVVFLDDVNCSALGMINLSDEKFRAGQFVDVAYYEPFYLKEFIAGKPG